MNLIGIAIGATGLLLLCMFMWMLALSIRKKRLEQERREREIAYRKAIEKNRKQEREERITKAEEGHIATILYLAKEAERSNIKEALYWYNKAANLDNITGMYGIVRISNAMRQDLILKEQAKFWQICIAALQGSLPHQYEMGEAIFYGRGTQQNPEKAVDLMEKAAAKNHLEALIFLGDWYISEHNEQPKPTKSTEYYRQAAKLKSNVGRMKLGESYLLGRGCKHDFKQGCYWLERAAEKGHLPAMLKAGEAWMDYRPNGASIAYIWLFLAGQLGHEPARQLRDQVALNIGVDTVVGLQSLAKPMIKKVRDNKVNKHSIIKAFNKLYKREIPLYEENNSSKSESNIKQVSAPQADASENKVDFSQSPIDKS